MVILACILLVGLLLRAFYLREIVGNPDFTYFGADTGYHDYWARGIITGDWTPPPGNLNPQIQSRPYMRPPGYPYFLALAYLLTGSSYLGARVVQMLLGMVNCVLAYLLGRALFGRAVGLIVAALMSVYWVFIYYEGELHAPVLVVFLTVLLIHILRLWTVRITILRALAGGLVLGVLTVTRTNVLLFGPVVLAWGWWIARRTGQVRRFPAATLIFVAAGAIAVLPVTLHNYVAANDLVLVTPNGGLNLYIGNNEIADGYTPRIPRLKEISPELVEGWSCFNYHRVVGGIEKKLGKPMKYSEVSAYFGKKGTRFIREHPLRFLKLVVRKAVLFWGPDEVSNDEVVHYDREYSAILRHLPKFPLVLSLSVIGIVLLFVDFRLLQGANGPAQQSKIQRQLEISVLILLFVAIYFVSFLPFLVSGRFRVPVIPFLILFGAYGLYRLGQFVGARDFRKGICWGLVWIGLYVLANKSFVPYEHDQASWHYYQAKAYDFQKQFDQANREYRRVIQLRPNDHKAHNNLGYNLSVQGKHAEAISHFQEAIRAEPDGYKAHANLAVSLFALGRDTEAAAHLYEVLRAEPNNVRIRRILGMRGIRLAKDGKFAKAIEQYQEILKIQPLDADTYNRLGALFAQQGKMDQAVSYYSEALRLNPDWPDVLNNLAWILATQQQTKFRNPAKAIEYAERACELTNYEEPAMLDTLAAGYAAAGRFSDAAATAEKAIELLLSSGDEGGAEDIQNRLELYKQETPYRENGQAQETLKP